MSFSDEARRGVDPYADVDAVVGTLGKHRIPFEIPQTELLAGTSIEIACPVNGQITKISTIVQTAVTTGGVVTVEVGGTAVTGLSITVADSATKGTVQSDSIASSEATGAVSVGDRIEVIPSAAFDTAGALNGYLEITL